MKLKILNVILLVSAVFNFQIYSHTQLLIKLPTRSRPEQFFKMLDIYYQKLSGSIVYHFLISCDAHDTTMNNPHVIAKLQKYEHLSFYFNSTDTKIAAYNNEIEKHADFDVLLVVSDDMEPIANYYDKIIMDKMIQYFPDFDGVLNFHDGNVGERCNTMPIIGKKFYERFGYIYHPEYSSLFCDEELTIVSRMLGKEVVFYETIIKHNHPDWCSIYPNDDLYKRNQTFFALDEKVFKERQLRNFDLSNQVIRSHMKKEWSILLPTLDKNQPSFERIYQKLQHQIKILGLDEKIELLVFKDAGEYPTGYKRNELLRRSKGYYISFIDDTDDINDNYIKTIYEQIHQETDCIKIAELHKTRGTSSQKIEHFNHHHILKRHIAVQFLFPKTYHKDYVEWGRLIQESNFIKKTAIIDQPMYFVHEEIKPKKLVGLVQIRNESVLIEQCLHALSLYTDEIVILDDASDDNTVLICKSIAEKYHIEKIIQNQTSAWENRTESENRQKLLDAGRAVGGTHFIIIDADEMMSSHCAKNNFLRSLIFQLNPGDRLQMNIVHFWNSLNRYRIYFNEKMKYFIFCDDGYCFYEKKFLHVDRVPLNLSGGANLEFSDSRYALLHFGYINWNNVLIRQTWYKCLERIRSPHKSAQEINSWYPAHKEKNMETCAVPDYWLSGYDFFDSSLFEKAEQWRCKQIATWFNSFGKTYFADLDICNVDWDKI